MSPFNTAGLPKDVAARVKAQPFNRHGARARAAILIRHFAAVDAELVRRRARKANRKEARKTPSDRIFERHAAEHA